MSRLNHVIGVLHVQIKSQLKNGFSVYNTTRFACAYSTKAKLDEHFTEGPLKILQEKIQSNELKADEHQANVMVELQQLYDTIQTYTPIELKPKSSLLKWLPIKSTKSNKNAAPKGIYIYGSVGGGKTTLMDLFYNSCHSVSLCTKKNPIKSISDENVLSHWICVFF